MPEPYEFTERLFISQNGDYHSGGWLVDTRLWGDAEWKTFDELPSSRRFEWAIRKTSQLEKDFNDFVERLRDLPDDVEVRRFVIDEDGVTEVDEDDNPI